MEPESKTVEPIAEDEAKERQEQARKPRMGVFNLGSIVVACVLAIVASFVALELQDAFAKLDIAHSRYTTCANAANDLMKVSDFLTTESRMFVVSGDRDHMDEYLQEVTVTRRRNAAVSTLRTEAGGSEAVQDLEGALESSNDLAELEYYAMRLASDGFGLNDAPEYIADVELSAADEALTSEAKLARAQEIVFGSEYTKLKDAITAEVDKCGLRLTSDLKAEMHAINSRVNGIITAVIVVTMLLVLLVVINASLNYYHTSVKPRRKVG